MCLGWDGNTCYDRRWFRYQLWTHQDRTDNEAIFPNLANTNGLNTANIVLT